ncbi:MAG: hypothetical protein JWO36_560 [Myxococcales bacterium]|nr:hypothetical protein [Myxococcales bacterium]
MLRFEVREADQAALPAIDLDDRVVVIGSGPGARIRLPASAAKAEQVRIEAGAWAGAANVDGVQGVGGPIGAGVTLEIGTYRVHVAPAPAGAAATPPQRTESLARELVRSMLGAGAAPTLEVEHGPVIGAKRVLAPPESVLVIGRGDEATWVILDSDLSKAHAEIRRGWDGVRIIDLESKNGIKLDGASVRDALVHDGALIELGKTRIRFRDPAERHLRGESRVHAERVRRESSAGPPAAMPPAARPNALVFYGALAIMLLALAGLAWVLAT